MSESDLLMNLELARRSADRELDNFYFIHPRGSEARAKEENYKFNLETTARETKDLKYIMENS